MLKQLKPDRLYFVINIDEEYAPKIFQVLKEEEMKKGTWSEGDIDFEEWVQQTFGEVGVSYIKDNKNLKLSVI